MRPIEIAKHLAKLLQAGEITPHIHAVALALLWRCRAPGRNDACVSYNRIAELAGVSRTTVAEALARLRDLGLLTWEKTRLRIAWGVGVASRQWRNVYRWTVAATESARRTTDSRQEGKRRCEGSTRGMHRALRALHRALTSERQRKQSADEMQREAEESRARQLAALAALT